jgi:hypothetical protein
VESIGGICTSSIILLYMGGTFDPAHAVEIASACDDLCLESVSDRFDI